MFYREAGDFSTTYREDSQTFPIKFDRYRYYVVLAVAFGIIPFIINDYWASAVFVPFLIYAIAAIGLNILTGYCGQVSLGTGGFMAVGAYACYKLMTSFPDVNIVIHRDPCGLHHCGVGILFGLPSLRIKGFYLAVATLAAQFFLVWLFNRGAVVLQLLGLGPDQRARARRLRRNRHRAENRSLGAVSDLPLLRDALRLAGAEPDARLDWAEMDGHPRYGYRRRNHRGRSPEGKAVAFRGFSRSFIGYLGALFFAIYLGRG